MRKLVLVGIGSSLFAGGFSAQAAPIVASGWGNFTNLSDCDNSGALQNCRITSSSNGVDTQVQWGSQSSSNFDTPSRLTAVDVNINADTNNGGGLGVAIARLDWYNSATRAVSDLTDLAVRWTFSLNFTTPTGPDTFGSEAFDLTIQNPLNPAGDLLHGLRLAELVTLDNAISLAGIAMTNLRYAMYDAPGSGRSSFVDNVWYNDENNISSMYILADFRSQPTSVPEPTTLSLLGLGLLAIAARARRAARGSSR
jgi:PEP-CTERM motif